MLSAKSAYIFSLDTGIVAASGGRAIKAFDIVNASDTI
jgi:hypothetical protein